MRQYYLGDNFDDEPMEDVYAAKKECRTADGRVEEYIISMPRLEAAGQQPPEGSDTEVHLSLSESNSARARMVTVDRANSAACTSRQLHLSRHGTIVQSTSGETAT